jgi:peptidoglycan/LPS O-acetylase OafA/YrhL
MPRSNRPLFLARAPYKRRRLRDAARLLPVLGVLLMVLPLMWTPDSRVTLRSWDVAYFFLVWIGLIALAAAFAPGLRAGGGSEDEED